MSSDQSEYDNHFESGCYLPTLRLRFVKEIGDPSITGKLQQLFTGSYGDVWVDVPLVSVDRDEFYG